MQVYEIVLSQLPPLFPFHSLVDSMEQEGNFSLSSEKRHQQAAAIHPPPKKRGGRVPTTNPFPSLTFDDFSRKKEEEGQPLLKRKTLLLLLCSLRELESPPPFGVKDDTGGGQKTLALPNFFLKKGSEKAFSKPANSLGKLPRRWEGRGCRGRF